MRFPGGLRTALALSLGLLFSLTACTDEQTPSLPALAAAMDQTSVSGISSGAYMAGQFQVAHSKNVIGAAIIAGGPYGCAESAFADVMPGPGATFLNMSKAVNGCMLNALAMWGVPNPEMLASRARKLADKGLIDPLETLTTDRVYLFSGTKDRTVVPEIVAAAAEFYEKLGVPPEQVKKVADIPAGHGFVTEDQGLACSESKKPYIVDCDYDQAGSILSFVYGTLAPRATSPQGSLTAFDQRPFLQDFNNHGLADEGYVYVPSACRADGAACRVHIAFHGCAQNYATVGDAFIRSTGFGRWADTNKLIVLLPQTATGGADNPYGCWDWWGYTGRHYLDKQAPQITAVYRMLERLSAPPGSSS